MQSFDRVQSRSSNRWEKAREQPDQAQRHDRGNDRGWRHYEMNIRLLGRILQYGAPEWDDSDRESDKLGAWSEGLTVLSSSLVRSVTDTSMTFISPTPPMLKVRIPITTRRIFMPI